ncbi:hypothetical protein HYR99_33760 [Candidatus Poribacteria bacterium]|nr:hypothetical protein [Candidatus Poribacteria bacterium]
MRQNFFGLIKSSADHAKPIRLPPPVAGVRRLRFPWHPRRHGRLTERRLTAQLLVQAALRQAGLDESTAIQKLKLNRDDDFWTWVNRILKYLEDAASAPSIPASAVCALGMAIYYVVNRPTPTSCSPSQLDKWRHCYVGCKIGFWYPGGDTISSFFAIFKEIVDALGFGTAEWEDIKATLEGTWDCPWYQSCEQCCCEKGY